MSTPVPPPVTVVLAALALFGGALHARVVRPSDPADPWRLPSSDVDPCADPDLGAPLARALACADLPAPAYAEQVLTRSHPAAPASLALSVVYLAAVPAPAAAPPSRVASWLPLPAAPGALDAGAQSSLVAAVDRLHAKSAYTSLPCFLVSAPFTLGACQRAFEAVLGCALDRSAFRRRLFDARLLVRAPRPPDTAAPRRASHYRLVDSTRLVVFPGVVGAAAQAARAPSVVAPAAS